MRDYTKMEESNLEQQSVKTGLEYTCQDLRKQQVLAHIEFEREKQSLIAQIQNWKS